MVVANRKLNVRATRWEGLGQHTLGDCESFTLWVAWSKLLLAIKV